MSTARLRRSFQHHETPLLERALSKTNAWWWVKSAGDAACPEDYFDKRYRADELGRLNRKLASGISDPKELVEIVRQIRRLHGIREK